MTYILNHLFCFNFLEFINKCNQCKKQLLVKIFKYVKVLNYYVSTIEEMIKMKRMGVIVCLAFVVFVLITLPSISAVESNTVLNLKKSFSNKTPEQIKEQINDKIFSRLNNSYSSYYNINIT